MGNVMDDAMADQPDGAAQPLTVQQALAQAAATGLDSLDAQWLLAHLLQQPRTWLRSHADAPLPCAIAVAFTSGCQRLGQGEPLAYLLGEQGFHGLLLQVTPAVLVPRPDTETLVDWALALLPSLATLDNASPRVLDLGTGSGAVALAVAHGWPAAQISATDVSPAALAVAQANARRLALTVDFAVGDWWQAVPAGRQFELLLSNPPYIAGNDPHLPALRHEPLHALTPGGDGLGALTAIISGAPAHLASGGWLLLEHGWDQAAAVAALLQQAGFGHISSRADLAGRPRCSGGRWATPG